MSLDGKSCRFRFFRGTLFGACSSNYLSERINFMRETMKQEQGGFGFIPILFVAVVVAFTAAVLIIGWIWSWVHLRERETGILKDVGG